MREGHLDTYNFQEPVFKVPVLDVSRARLTTESIADLSPLDFPALRLAIVLMRYNLETNDSVKPQAQNRVNRRIEKLRQRELFTADTSNPLPTIGIEVEIPRKTPQLTSYAKDPNVFFDAIGMPRNKDNHPYPEYKEYGTPPAYSASTQSAILHELIAGGFLPSLSPEIVGTSDLFFDTPNPISKFLDHKLVSLHINLAIPVAGDQSKPLITVDDVRQHTEIQFLTSALTFAYSSPERIAHRKSATYVMGKEGTSGTLKGGTLGRVEMKTFEVNNRNTYRLLSEAQCLGAALFSWIARENGVAKDNKLSQIWAELSPQIRSLFQLYNATPDILRGNATSEDSSSWLKFEAAELSRTTDISSKFRNLLSEVAIEIARKLHPQR